MEVTRIHEGLWRWAVRRDGAEAASAYLEHGDQMLLVDPVLPDAGDDRDRFARAIERDLARLPGPRWVLLTGAVGRRDADALAAMTGATIIGPGDAAPAGIESLATGRTGQVALWCPSHAALMPGTAVAVNGGTPVADADADAAALLALPARVVIPSAGPMWVAS